MLYTITLSRAPNWSYTWTVRVGSQWERMMLIEIQSEIDAQQEMNSKRRMER